MYNVHHDLINLDPLLLFAAMWSDAEYENFCEEVQRESSATDTTPKKEPTAPLRQHPDPVAPKQEISHPSIPSCHEKAASAQIPSPNICCWRCGRLGHLRTTCRNTPIIFCSVCGKPGTLSKHCCRRTSADARRHSVPSLKLVNKAVQCDLLPHPPLCSACKYLKRRCQRCQKRNSSD